MTVVFIADVSLRLPSAISSCSTQYALQVAYEVQVLAVKLNCGWLRDFCSAAKSKCLDRDPRAVLTIEDYTDFSDAQLYACALPREDIVEVTMLAESFEARDEENIARVSMSDIVKTMLALIYRP
jgi:hypothetical protein